MDDLGFGFGFCFGSPLFLHTFFVGGGEEVRLRVRLRVRRFDFGFRSASFHHFLNLFFFVGEGEEVRLRVRLELVLEI